MPGGHGGVAVLVALVLLSSGCSGSDGTAGDALTTTPSTPEATDATAALRERCLSAMPEDAPLAAVTLTGSSGAEIEAARIGPATTERVAILLPQTGGLCGWGRWATAATDAGLTSLIVNPCGYGETVCTAEEDADPLHEVAAAAELARGEYGAERVVLLGTSMGGSLPDDGLVVMAPSDGEEFFAAAEALAETAGVRFLPGRSGHGWELLVNPVSGSVTRIGRRLMAFAEGPSGT